MLILRRKPGEKIYIGENREIVITLLSGSRSSQVGIDCPPEMPIVRAELLNEDRENFNNQWEEAQ